MILLWQGKDGGAAVVLTFKNGHPVSPLDFLWHRWGGAGQGSSLFLGGLRVSVCPTRRLLLTILTEKDRNVSHHIYSPADITEGSLITAGWWWKSWLFTRPLTPLRKGGWSVWLLLDASGSLGSPLGLHWNSEVGASLLAQCRWRSGSLLSLLWHHPVGVVCVCACMMVGALVCLM